MKIPIMKPIINREMQNAAVEALKTEQLVMGDSVFKFEEAFADYIGTKYAISTSSGTNALSLALCCLGIGNSDKVITSPMSFIATSNAILHNNAVPYFTDIKLDSGNIDISTVDFRDASAILPVHLYGNIIDDMEKLLKIKEKYNLFFIEDVAQAHGATFKNKKAGSFGDAGCFSFYSTKNMTVGGDGGMITTNNKKLYNDLRKITNCGRKSKYVHDILGYTARLNSVNAAIGLVQLKYIDIWNDNRRRAAKIYSEILPKNVQLKYEPGSVYYTYTIKTSKRDLISEHLSNNKIGNGVYYPIPIPLQPLYKNLYGYKNKDFERVKTFCDQVLSLPMFPDISEQEVKFVCEKVNEVIA